MNSLRSNRNHDFTFLLVSNIINRCGDSLDTILFSWLVYAITAQAAWSAVIFGINQATSVLLQPFIGPLVEKFNKRKNLIFTDLIRAITVFAVLMAYHSNILSPWLLIATTIIISTIEAFHMPAGVAVIQQILPENEYDRGISKNVSLTKIAVLAGNGIAGVLIAVLGVQISLLIDAAAFVLSAGFICRISVSASNEEKSQPIDQDYLHSLKDGFRYIFGKAELIRLCALCILINSAVVPFDALMTPIAVELFHGTSKTVSLLSLSITVGTIIGAFIFSKMKETQKRDSLVTFCGIALGLYYLSLTLLSKQQWMGIYRSFLLMIASAGIGIALGAMMTYVQVLFVKKIEPEYIGRVTAIRFSLTYACAPVVSFILSGVSAKMDIYRIMLVSGAVTIGAFGLAGFLLCRGKNG